MKTICKNCNQEFNRPGRRHQFCSQGCWYSYNTVPAIDRFWRHVEIGSFCWLWTGCVFKKTGYPYFGIGQEDTWKPILAHRFSYEIHVGSIPPGYDINHLCHNADKDCKGGSTCEHRRCINPEHLEAVTHAVHMLREHAANKPTCIRGHSLTDPSNVYLAFQGNGRRVCRACHAIHERKRRARDNTSAPTQ